MTRMDHRPHPRPLHIDAIALAVWVPFWAGVAWLASAWL